MQSSAPAASIAADPLWWPHRYDPEHDAVHLVRMDRGAHRAATFLTDEELPTAAERLVLGRPDLAAPATAPLHFIFHSAFCCSTLLARAMDLEGVAMGLKEPVILNDLVGWRHRGGPPQRVGVVLDHALQLLARPFGPHERVIIKPSNVVNGLAPAMLAMRPSARALLLYTPLRNYLNSIARKGMWGRLWVRDLLGKQLKEGMVALGFTPEDHFAQTDLQVAAVGWLVQHALFGRMVERFGPERVRTLDSEILLARPGDTMAALSDLFELGLGETAVRELVEGPVFNRHSKGGARFDSEARRAEQRDAAVVHAEEIDKVTTWAEAVATNAGVPITLPGALID
jgi:hypothetical protein